MKQNSPIIIGLLVAATISVDAVAISWLLATGPLSGSNYVYDPLISGQLAIACIWAAFAARRTLFAWLGLAVAVLVVSQLGSMLISISFGEFVGIYGSYAALLVVCLWVVKRTKLWQRLTGSNPTVWQFSMAHLLAAMTLIAVLIVSLRSSELIRIGETLWTYLTVLTVFDALANLTTLVIWATPWHWLKRLAAACAAAGLWGGAASMFETLYLLQRSVIPFVAYAIIMCVVVFVWLELVPIVPHARRAASLPPAGADAS